MLKPGLLVALRVVAGAFYEAITVSPGETSDLRVPSFKAWKEKTYAADTHKAKVAPADCPTNFPSTTSPLKRARPTNQRRRHEDPVAPHGRDPSNSNSFVPTDLEHEGRDNDRTHASEDEAGECNKP